MRVQRSLLVLLAFSLPFVARSTDFASPPAVVHAAHESLSSHHAPSSPLQRGNPAPAGAQALPVVVEGSRTPELVPDRVATRFFVLSLVHPGRRAAIMARLQMAPADRANLESALESTPTRIATLSEQRKDLRNGTPESNSARAALKREEDHLLDATYGRITGALSPEAAVAADHYIRTRVKGRLKGFSMSAAQQ